MQNDRDNVYMEKSLAISETDFTKQPIVKISQVLPVLNPLIIVLFKNLLILSNTLRKWVPSLMRNVPMSPINWIVHQIGQVVKERASAGKKRMDLLQLMMDAAHEDEVKVSLFGETKTIGRTEFRMENPLGR